MSYSVELTRQAEDDLRGVFEYIAFTLLAGDNAVAQLARLEDAIAKLSHHPMRYQAWQTEPWRSRGMRCMAVDRYRVFYIPDEERACVTVMRVMYDGRDADARLNDLEPDE